MRVLVVVGRLELDAGRSAWLHVLSDNASVELWRTPEGAASKRALATALGGVRGAVRSPLRAARALVAGGFSNGLRAGVRSLPVATRRADVLYFPRPEDAFGFLPLMRLRPTVVSLSPGEGGRVPAGVRRVLEEATIVHHSFDVDRCEVELGDIAVSRWMPARAGFDPRVLPSRRAPDPPHPFRVLIAAGLWPGSGIDDALVAARRARELGLELSVDIVGAGPERERVVHAIHELVLGTAASVRDPLPPEGLIEAICGAHALVQPHLLGALGWPALTAMAVGVPVIAVNAGAASEVISDGRHGFVVQHGDVDAIADRLVTISRDAQLVSSLADRSRIRIKELFEPRAQREAFWPVLEAAFGRGAV